MGKDMKAHGMNGTSSIISLAQSAGATCLYRIGQLYTRHKIVRLSKSLGSVRRRKVAGKPCSPCKNMQPIVEQERVHERPQVTSGGQHHS